MKEIKQKRLTGERALFKEKDLKIYDCIFEEGESPLKESENIEVFSSMFRWKYPVWYAKNVKVENSFWFDMARAGVWYTKNMSVKDCIIEAPKNFRRCEGLSLENVTFTRAEETLWNCSGVKMKNVRAKGDYFAMNCSGVEADGLELVGNYGFDSVKNVVIRNSKLLTKDAFWNSENVTVYDSFISGEYLGWNAKNLTLINCTVESLQGMCYIENLKMVNCKLLNTTLSFEYCSNIDATINSRIDSVKNPISGKIVCKGIDELIMEKDKIDPSKTEIVILDDDEI